MFDTIKKLLSITPSTTDKLNDECIKSQERYEWQKENALNFNLEDNISECKPLTKEELAEYVSSVNNALSKTKATIHNYQMFKKRFIEEARKHS